MKKFIINVFNKVTVVFFVFFMIICTSYFISCSNIFKNEQKEVNEQNKAKVLLTFVPSERTVIPDANLKALKEIVIEGDLKGGISSHFKHSFDSLSSATSTSLLIEPGVWDFKLTAKKDNIEFSSFLSKNEITEGENTLIFVLEIESLGAENDKGNVAISLNFPKNGNVIGVKAGLFTIEDDFPVSGFELKSLRPKNNSITYSVNSVPIGNYRFKAFLYADETYTSIINIYREFVTVASGLTSSASRSIESLNEVYKIDYEMNGGVISSAYVAPEVYTRSSEFLLSTAENITKEGFAFVGWYETNDFSSERITKIERNTIGNKKFYAKWAEGKVITTSNISKIDFSSVNEGYTIAVVGDVDLKLLANKLKSAENVVSLDLFASNVTLFEDSLFSGCKKISKIVLPEKLTKIGKEAFYGCSGLNEFTITDKITEIGENAFGNCSSLSEIEVSKENNLFKSVEGVLFSGDGKTLIQYLAGKTDIEYTIPDETVSVAAGAFSGNSYISTIRIGSLLKNISENAFNNCQKINSFVVDSSNPTYDDNNGSGILYSESTLVHYPVGRTLTTFTLPAWVTKIGDYAFYACTNIETITIPTTSELVSIGNYAFYGCSSLANFNLPENLNYVGGYAFTGCSSTFNYCTVVFNTNGGSKVESVSVKKGETISLPAAPIKKGYSFSGWYSDSSYSKSFTSSTTIKENMNVYAKWTILTYSITYILNGGTNNTDNPKSYTVENESIKLKIPSRTGYTFEGWYKDSYFTGDVVTEIEHGSTGGMTLYAKWDLTEYTIKYYLNGGTNAKENPDEYTIEANTITLVEPQKDGYIFDGWFTDSSYTGTKQTSIEKGSYGNKVFYAKWLKKCTITYVTEYGEAPNSIIVREGAKLTSEQLPVLKKEGYLFKGWYNGTLLIQSDNYTVKGDVALTAKWVISYTIDYVTDFGTKPACKTVESGTVLTSSELMSLKKTDYLFRGWYTDKECSDDNIVEPGYIVKNNITLYAKWVALSSLFTVTATGSGWTRNNLKWTAFSWTESANATIKLELKAPLKITFKWESSPLYNRYDYGSYMTIDETTIMKLYNKSTSGEKTMELSAGTHTIKLQCTIDCDSMFEITSIE